MLKRFLALFKRAAPLPVPVTTEEVLVRLSPDVYAQLLKQMPGLYSPKTELEAGYLLGVQFTLQKLRDGFVSQR
jgi:hypothetical protein